MSKAKEQVQGWIKQAQTQEELVARLVDFTEAAKQRTSFPAKYQIQALDWIEKIAVEKGQVAGGVPSLGQTIATQQHHRIAQYQERAYCLSEKQMAVIVRENWGYIKAA